MGKTSCCSSLLFFDFFPSSLCSRMNPKEEIVAVRFAGPSDVRVDQRLLRPNDVVGTDSKIFLYSASVDIGYSLDGPCYRAEDDSNTYDGYGYGNSSLYEMAAEKPSEEAEEKKE
jgi:hypothetical protein